MAWFVFCIPRQEVEIKWKAAREEMGITSRATGPDNKSYEQRYWTYITEHFPNKFQSWRQYDLAKAFLHAVSSLGVQMPFRSQLRFRVRECCRWSGDRVLGPDVGALRQLVAVSGAPEDEGGRILRVCTSAPPLCRCCAILRFFSWVSTHVDFLAKGLETNIVVQVLHSIGVAVTKVWKGHVNLPGTCKCLWGAASPRLACVELIVVECGFVDCGKKGRDHREG